MSAAPRSALPLRRPQLVGSEPRRNDPAEDRSIGDIIRETKNLSEEQVDRIVEYQRTNNVRFGDAAVALGLATDADVVFALSQQFHYPYTSEARRDVHPELVTATQPFGQQAEAFRAIRSQLMMKALSANEPKRALAIVSPNAGDGKTFLAANLAVVLAQLGGRTLVIDADLRGPRLHQLFGIPNTSGLSGILSGRQDENVIYQAPEIPSLFVMPVGVVPPNPLELLERPAFRLLIGELMRKFDHVVVDTSAAAHGTDATVVASKCGAALMLTRKSVTRVAAVGELATTITSSGARLAGAIVNEF